MEWTDKLGAVVAAGAMLQVREAWLNGEVVVLLPGPRFNCGGRVGFNRTCVLAPLNRMSVIHPMTVLTSPDLANDCL